ncbi:MAG: GAF domain-containing protein, partial [Candidatus Aquicultor sp.]
MFKVTPKNGIRKKLLLGYLAITIPLIIVIIFTHYNRYEDKRRDILQSRLIFARDISSNFDHFVKEVSTTERAMGIAITENNYTRRKASEYLSRISNRYPVFSLDFVRADGQIYASTDPSLVGTKLMHDKYDINYDLKKLSPQKDWFTTPLHIHQHGGIGFDVITPVWRKSKLAGVMVASVDSTRLNEIFVFEVPGGGYNITDNNGMLIYQNQFPNKLLSERNWGANRFIKIASSGKEFTSTGLTFPIDNSYRMGVQVPIHSLGWSAGSFVPVEEVMAPIRTDIVRSGVAASMIVLLAVLLGFWISERIVKPITVLADKAKAIARGSFDEDIGLIKTGDEIEDLAESFNTMRINLKEYVNELSGLVETGEKMNLALNIPFVEGAVTTALRNYFDAKAVWIALYDEREKQLKVDHFWSENEGVDLSVIKMAPGQGVAGKVLMTGKPTVIKDLTKSEFLFKDVALQAGIDSEIALPLVSGGGSLGVIGLYTPLTRQDRITEKEMGLLMALANQAAVAIENARLYEETRESERKLKASNDDLRILNKVALDISSGLDLQELLGKTVTNAVDLVAADIGAIGLYNEENGRLEYHYNAGSSVQLRGIPDDLGLAETVLKIRKSVFTNDYRHDPRASKEALVRGVSAVAVAPLFTGNRVIGVIQVASANAKMFSDTDVALLEAVANQAAVAIENAKLYERERDVAETLQNALLAVPDRLDGIKLGLLYRAATERSKVGGDFYDFIEFTNGRIGIVVGDVSGKGLQAATVTALAKMTIRAFAYEYEQPAQVLAHANSVLTS